MTQSLRPYDHRPKLPKGQAPNKQTHIMMEYTPGPYYKSSLLPNSSALARLISPKLSPKWRKWGPQYAFRILDFSGHRFSVKIPDEPYPSPSQFQDFGVPICRVLGEDMLGDNDLINRASGFAAGGICNHTYGSWHLCRNEANLNRNTTERFLRLFQDVCGTRGYI